MEYDGVLEGVSGRCPGRQNWKGEWEVAAHFVEKAEMWLYTRRREAHLILACPLHGLNVARVKLPRIDGVGAEKGLAGSGSTSR